MKTGVYKSEEGRVLVEAYCRKTLDSFTAVPLERRFIATPQGRTHVLAYVDSGKPPLILLHGSMSNSASWFGMLPDLAASFSVYCVDIPGEPGLSEAARVPLAARMSLAARMPLTAGKSESEPPPPAIWLGAALDGLGLESASFLGMSLGSFYALTFAVANPARVRALSMITTGGIAPQKASFLFKALFFMLLGAPGQALLNRTVYHKAVVPPEIHEFQALVSANFNPMTESLPIFTDAELRRLAMPIQYFGGDRDALLDTTKTAQRLSALFPRADIRVLKDTGHVIIDQGRAVKAFLEEQRRGPMA